MCISLGAGEWWISFSADHGRVPVDWVSRLGLFSFGRLNFAASTGKRLSKEAHNERRLIAEQK